MKLKVFELSTIDMTLYKFVLPLMKELRSENYEVICGARDLGYLAKIEAEGFSTYPLPLTRTLNPIMLIKSLITLVRIFKKEKIDVLHVHTPIAGIIGRLAAALSGVPIKIYTVHGFIVTPVYYYFIEKIMAKFFTTHIFTVSQEDAKYAIEHNFIKRECLTAINSVGINSNYFDPNQMTEKEKNNLLKNLNINDNQIVIGYIGRIVKEKGVLDLIQAFNQLKNRSNLILLLVGPFDMNERPQDSIQSEILDFILKNDLEDYIVMPGYREDIRELISIMDIFVLPSYREGMPVSLLEAMSMETAVIGSDIRGIREEIDVTCGLLYPKGDIKQLKLQIEKYLDNSSIKLQNSKNARQKVVTEFDEYGVIKKQIAIFDRYKLLLKQRC